LVGSVVFNLTDLIFFNGFEWIRQFALFC
jgi:hypothetical protein